MDLKLLLIVFFDFTYAWSDSDSSDNGDLTWNYFFIKRAYKTCFFLVDRQYRAGEYELIINTDTPTFNLFSDSFVTFDSRRSGMQYRVTNIRHLTAGLHFMGYTVKFYGWNRPHCRCYSPKQITFPTTSQPVPKTISQTVPITTSQAVLITTSQPVPITTTKGPSTMSSTMHKTKETTTVISPKTTSKIIYTTTDKKITQKATTISYTFVNKQGFTISVPTLPRLPTRKPTTNVSTTILPTRKPPPESS